MLDFFDLKNLYVCRDYFGYYFGFGIINAC